MVRRNIRVTVPRPVGEDDSVQETLHKCWSVLNDAAREPSAERQRFHLKYRQQLIWIYVFAEHFGIGGEDLDLKLDLLKQQGVF